MGVSCAIGPDIDGPGEMEKVFDRLLAMQINRLNGDSHVRALHPLLRPYRPLALRALCPSCQSNKVVLYRKDTKTSRRAPGAIKACGERACPAVLSAVAH